MDQVIDNQTIEKPFQERRYLALPYQSLMVFKLRDVLIFLPAIPRKWRENPKGNKEIWESSVRLGHKVIDIFANKKKKKS